MAGVFSFLRPRCGFGLATALTAVAALLTSSAPSLAVGCGDACCDSCDCGDGISNWMHSDYDRFWITGEYLLWQVDGSSLPPLVTSSPAGTPIGDAGVLGDPSTTILAGNQGVNNAYRSGWGISGGFWVDPCHGLAIIGDYFNAGRDSYGYAAGPNTGDIIMRPFYNAEAGEQDAELVDVPNELAGRVGVQAYQDFQGAGGGLQKCLWSCDSPCDCRSAWIAAVGGYRYYQHDSLVGVREDLTVLPGTTSPLVPGTQIAVQDRFAAHNQFNGGEFGLQGRMQRREFWVDGTALLAIGANRREVYIDGSTDNTVPGAGSASFQGGLLTSEVTNIGRYADTKAVVIPRFRIGLGCQLTELLSARAGYNLILWNDVVQAASTLPPGLASDPRNLPPVQGGGGPDPRFPGMVGSSLVAHGFDFGVTLQY